MSETISMSNFVILRRLARDARMNNEQMRGSGVLLNSLDAPRFRLAETLTIHKARDLRLRARARHEWFQARKLVRRCIIKKAEIALAQIPASELDLPTRSLACGTSRI